MHQKNCICKTLWYDSRIYLFCVNILLLFLLFLTFTKPVLLSRFKCKFLIVPYSANRSARDSSSASWWTPRTITIHPSIAYKIKYKRYREKESTLLLTIYTLDLFLISFLYKYYIHKTEKKKILTTFRKSTIGAISSGIAWCTRIYKYQVFLYWLVKGTIRNLKGIHVFQREEKWEFYFKIPSLLANPRPLVLTGSINNKRD